MVLPEENAWPGKSWLPSLAQAVGKQHYHLMRDIAQYIDTLQKATNPKVDWLEFFKPAFYNDAKGEERHYYFVTHKDCDVP